MGIWDDTFTGTDGDDVDSSKWERFEDHEGAFDISSNTYRLDVSCQRIPDVTMRWRTGGRCGFEGDFDIQIDFASKYCWYANGCWQIYSFGICTIDESIWETIGLRHYSGYSYEPTVFGSYASNSPENRITTGASLAFTKLRFTRSGSVVKGYLWDNSQSQWEWNGGTDGYTFTGIEDNHDVRPYLRQVVHGSDGGTSVHVAFDNFLVNSGTAYALPLYAEIDAEIGFNVAYNGFTETAYQENELGLNCDIDAQTDWVDQAFVLGLNATVEPNGSIYNVNNINHTLGFSGEVEAFNVSVYIDEDLGLNGDIDADYQTKWISNGLGLNAAIDAHREYPVDIDVGIGFNISHDSYNYSNWETENLYRSRKIFILTLTGSADSTTDVEVPFSSLTARKRTDAKTYIGVVVPYAYADYVIDRPNGEMIVEAAYIVGDAISLREEILRASLDTIDDNKGAKNRSITLTGYKTNSYGPKEVPLTNPIYRRLSNGTLQYRFVDIDLFLNPGDILTVGTDTFTVGNITYYISPNNQTMEVFEAEV